MSLPLPNEFNDFFSNHEEHITKNLLITAEGIFAAKTTNLNFVKDKLPNILENQSTTKPGSNYQRLIRFFNMSNQEKRELTKSLLCICFCILGLKGHKPKYLALDGTSWEFGEKKIHLLTLSVVIGRVSIPICWEDLDKKGTSNYDERKSLFERACKWYDLKGMVLLADREYIGRKWFKYLVGKGLDFVIRAKKNIYKQEVDTQREGYSRNFMHQKFRYIGMERKAAQDKYRYCGVAKQIKFEDGQKYTFVIFKNPKKDPKEPLVYFISTLKRKKKIVQVYPIRWTIECCFKHLKTNGFNLEELNLKKSEKIKLMMAIVTFLYVLCINEGFIAYLKVKKSDFKKYADGKVTLAVSVFRKGLSIVEAGFSNLRTFFKYLVDIIRHKKVPDWVHV